MKYFEVVADDVRFRDRWFLDEPLDSDGNVIDARNLTDGVPYTGLRPVTVPIQQPGRHIAFTFAAFELPVVAASVGKIFNELCPADIQLFPVRIDSAADGYEILNIAVTADCIDERCSHIVKWSAEDGRPDKVGKYRTVGNLKIDPERVGNRQVFRVRGWEVALILTNRIREALSQFTELGVVFRAVT